VVVAGQWSGQRRTTGGPRFSNGLAVDDGGSPVADIAAPAMLCKNGHTLEDCDHLKVEKQL
jgi:hypothetical protein